MLTATVSAAEVMKTDVITVAPNEHIRDALAMMVENHVSGLPVVDGRGRCVGVLSAFDILGLEYEQAEATDVEEDVGSYFDTENQRWEYMRIGGGVDELPDQTVHDVVSAEVISVTPDACIKDVARLMTKKGIHRVLVLNDKRELCGLISALDLVRIVAEED